MKNVRNRYKDILKSAFALRLSAAFGIIQASLASALTCTKVARQAQVNKLPWVFWRNEKRSFIRQYLIAAERKELVHAGSELLHVECVFALNKVFDVVEESSDGTL